MAAFLGIGFCIWAIHAIVSSDLGDTWNKVKTNDKLYADDFIFSGGHGGRPLDIYQLALPATAHDIDTMHITEGEKRQWRYGIDTTEKPELIRHAVLFELDSMYEYNTSFCGTLVRKDSMDWDMNDKWYVIKPNFKYAIKNDVTDSLPAGYVLHDEYYIQPTWVSLHEASPFLKQTKKHK